MQDPIMRSPEEERPDSPHAETGCDILVIEDSLTQALKLQRILTQQGHRVTLARNGHEALSLLASHHPNLIISDIMMPGMDGYETCLAIKQNPEWEHIPVVLLTSLSDPEDIVRGLRARADSYLTKPYNVEYLLSTINTLLANPPCNQDEEGDTLEVLVAGQSYAVKSTRRQMVNLLLSIYGGAVQRNRELEGMQAQLQSAYERLAGQQSALEDANRQLLRMATHDALTGVKNRGAFNEKIEDELGRARRYGQPLSLLLLDIDKFKSLNDTFGHTAGDEVIKHVAHLASEVSRTTDFVARYGGEEFAILLPNTPADGALVWAERIRLRIGEEKWERRPITASLGVATCCKAPSCAVSVSQFINQADVALYHSKQTGRNRTTHFDQMPNPPAESAT